VIGNFVLELLSTQNLREESKMDRAASAGFEGIAQMLLEQKKLMDALEAENRELRRQLADLRRGVGVAVVIEGKTIQLATEPGGSPVPMNPQTQQALQSLQNLQAQQMPQQGNGYQQNRQSTGNQQPVPAMSNGDKRDNGSNRSPLADSFVL
jgi:hypothetical protein